MQFYVRFTVVKRYVPLVVRALWLLFAVGLIVSITALLIDSVRFLGIYAGGCFMLAAVVQNFFDRYKEIGACALTDQEIIVASGADTTRYQLSTITDLKLYFRGYMWMELEPVRVRSGMKVPDYSDGDKSELVFRYEGEEIRIGLMFYEQHLSAMNTLFAIWEEQGISYELYGRKRIDGKRFSV
ncbi:hypothetical protein [Chitinophaga qingshengii]|uniref:Uncharacterized protein n=1 Tax=Chitinophaga qingshengii TaxID=1569794 RepID=A0ABR7TZ80_9BACT|nr:hypothetical protein [Chitinophaga qingshengii]MBC9934614.1 hypothetical protein [Chitinophaga qingshengii]